MKKIWLLFFIEIKGGALLALSDHALNRSAHNFNLRFTGAQGHRIIFHCDDGANHTGSHDAIAALKLGNQFFVFGNLLSENRLSRKRVKE